MTSAWTFGEARTLRSRFAVRIWGMGVDYGDVQRHRCSSSSTSVLSDSDSIVRTESRISGGTGLLITFAAAYLIAVVLV